MTACMTAAVEAGQRMFTASVMGSLAYVALTIMCLVGMEVVEWLGPAFGQRTVVAVPWVKPVVDVAVETVGTVEPWSGADEDAADEPVGTVVTVGRAVIGRVVEVAIWANRGYSDADGNLGRRYGGSAQQEGGQGDEKDRSFVGHTFSSVPLDFGGEQKVVRGR
jgi:hypothetical protein